jgi:MoxR-like ATPase
MKSTSNGSFRETAFGIYRYIQEQLYCNRPDLEVKGRKFNSALLLSLITGLQQGKELIIGEPGLGKTTSAEYVCALLYGIPLEVIWTGEVSGHPEQTEEKIVGRPDLGRLNQGEEVVVWSYFSLLPAKIVDELNRLPETKQSMILDGVDRGNWVYLNDSIINREYCLFATCNYQDRGTNTLIAPLLDRFDILVESKHPGANLAYLIGTKNSHAFPLRDEKLEDQFREVLTDKISYAQKVDGIEKLSQDFRRSLKKKPGIETLSAADRRKIRSQIRQIPFDMDANAFLRLVLAELSFCHPFGQKRSQDDCPEGCHFSAYLCHSIRNCISNRLPISAHAYARALAWFLGDETVDVEHLKVVLPHVLAHRIQWQEKPLDQKKNEARNDPLPIYMAKEAVEEMFRRYHEQGLHLKNALAVANQIMGGENLKPIEGDHPLYWEIQRDLREGGFA